MAQGTSVCLRQHGLLCAEFTLDSGPFDKTIKLLMQQPGKPPSVLLELTMLGEKLVYSSLNNQPVIKQGEEPSEHAKKHA
jgi:hypothetical protein